MSAASIELQLNPQAQYLLRVGDTCLILAQRLGEWCGHAPILEEDIAMSNIALDLIGQARALLTRAGEIEGRQHDEDQLAFLRNERDYFNLTMVELPRGDFAFSVLRNTMVSTWLKLLWERLGQSSDHEVRAIAGKALKEARYHQQHSGDWVVRLGDGTDESRQRMEAALAQLWRYASELFDTDPIDEQASAEGIGPLWSELQAPWKAEMELILGEAGLAVPADSAFRSDGKRGRHSEHMGFILADMQYLQRSFPGGVW
ncbi:1,2-phenylacetyl-CoA epoxidase subunit PaaC [Variovorax sp. J22R133]|uniref:1,2-phenylacetyl-CoA epoxidase subunit PaaC n=1 Tax=Variovorax brevis TaxID=3053503 RepID=UPI0025789E09|nr:1,2-phenylacetyl-CoA epoxidase subunit PaaC [Variovorax sp. J22R133]MDM0114092.1 1,2-phenylacetyl-CoA epoxidase subunit PaaC [Variovorax sp. J22R133]